MIDTVKSKSNVPIRITPERWGHVTEEHCELAGRKQEVIETIANPDKIVVGNHQELLAFRKIDERKFLVAVYKEVSNFDGFLITSFLTTKENSLNKRKQIWPKEIH